MLRRLWILTFLSPATLLAGVPSADVLVVPPETTRVEPRIHEAPLAGNASIGKTHQSTVRGNPNAAKIATLLALDVSDEIFPPEDLVERIRADLEAIYAAFPLMTTLGPFPRLAHGWMPGRIIVHLDDEGVRLFTSGTFEAFDALNEKYGPVKVESRFLERFRTLILSFTRTVNPYALRLRYAELPGVESTEPDHFLGDGDRVAADPPRYTFSLGRGDCPSGCIFRHTWAFRVDIKDDDKREVSLVGESGPPLKDMPTW